MTHNPKTRGDTVYCYDCGCQWDIREDAPEQCCRTAPATSRLYAYLVGPQTPNTDPSLVYAYDKSSALRAMSTVTGIHEHDLFAVRADAMDGYCKVRTACPSFNPADLERAAQLCAALMRDHFPGATAVTSPFRHKTRKQQKELVI